MNAVLRIMEGVATRVRHHVFAMPGEGFAFLMCRLEAAAEGVCFVAEDALLVPDDAVRRDETGWSLSDEVLDQVLNQAVKFRKVLVEVHSHPGGAPTFSRTDRLGLRPFAEFVVDSLGSAAYGATVWTEQAIYGEAFVQGEGVLSCCRMRTAIVGNSFALLDPEPRTEISESFHRQTAWFGEDVQRMLGRVRVGIVGLSGTGTHVLQALALLGVRDYVLIDHDRIGIENLNRIPIATAQDVGTVKTEIARRFVKQVVKSASVACIEAPLGEGTGAADELLLCDAIFGCVDNDGPRLLLNRLSVRGAIPYVDVASGILRQRDGHLAGARLAVTLPAQACLVCTEELDMIEVRNYFTPDDELRRQVALGYVEEAGMPSPSVVSLNAMIAHAGVMEFLMLMSGARPVALRADLDIAGSDRPVAGPYLVPRRNVRRRPGCVECFLGDPAA